ncbi:TonB family protein [Emticicia fluvialis]|uniref:TonB family protein n=1 Tax=Emticicia fluvialis TaxID=2974474 RepID=UPI00216621F3|nr:TonB family protein [Emticicia fluvialis]
MDFLFYLVQVNLYFILFYGFYRLILFGETFHNLNRFYLVLSALLSFGIPLWYSEYVQSWFITREINLVFYNLYNPSVIGIHPADGINFTWGDVLKILYIAGISLFTVRLLVTLMQLIVVLRNKDFEKFTAFSFFGYSFVDETLKKRDTILAHEHVHMQQLHSADVMLFEIIAILNWFNPVVYLYKRDIKHIHEFIADEIASLSESSKADYALLLFTQEFGLQPDYLTNRFFTHSTLKRRIQMLSKPRSRKIMLLKYGMSVPLFILMLVLSSATIAKNEMLEIVEVNFSGLKNSSVNLNPLATPQIVITETKNIEVSGKVISKSGGVGLPGVSVLVVNASHGTITDAEGKYRINVAENDTLQFSMAGFETVVVPVAAKNVIDVVLKEKALANIALAEVEISKPQTTTVLTYDQIFDVVDEHPEYPGGLKAMYEFISGNLRYPIEAQRKNVSGKVFIKFVVHTDGTISDFKVLKGVGYGCEEEAIRVISQMPRWKPGKVNGKPVNVIFTMPISFVTEAKPDMKMVFSLPARDNSGQLKLSGLESDKDVLFVLDGKVTNKDELARINHNDISEISVLKDQLAINSYGKRAKDGAVIIHTIGYAELKK